MKLINNLFRLVNIWQFHIFSTECQKAEPFVLAFLFKLAHEFALGLNRGQLTSGFHVEVFISSPHSSLSQLFTVCRFSSALSACEFSAHHAQDVT